MQAKKRTLGSSIEARGGKQSRCWGIPFCTQEVEEQDYYLQFRLEGLRKEAVQNNRKIQKEKDPSRSAQLAKMGARKSQNNRAEKNTPP